jgi:hypothetical protein
VSNRKRLNAKVVAITVVTSLAFVAIVIFFAITREASDSVVALQDTERLLEENLKPLRTFREEGGVAMGCSNTLWANQLPLPRSGASQTDVEKIKAFNEYMTAVWNQARALDTTVKQDEEALKSLSVIPNAVGALPWERDKYTAVLARMSSRVAWARSELSDHSCSKK